MVLAILIAGLVGAIPAAAQPDDPTPAPLREIYTVLQFGDPVFEPGLWMAHAAEEADRTTATWRADGYGALAHAEYLHFGDGYNPDNLGAFFDDGWFGVSFKDYDSWEQVRRCRIAGMTVHEFALAMGDQAYQMRYWIQPITPTRILTLQMVFPAGRERLLEEYSRLFAPLAYRCPG